MNTQKINCSTRMILTFSLIMVFAIAGKREAFSQNTSAESVSYKDLHNSDFVSQYKITFDVSSYVAKDGSVLKVGSPLIIGVPEKNIEKRDNFPFVHWQLVTMIGKIKGYQEMNGDNAREKVEIEEIKATSNSISKKEPRYITMLVKNSSGKRRFLTDYETAIETGEVVNPNATPTMEQAVKMMKDAKELLDMGVMTQQKFDSIKSVLSPILLK